MSDQETGQTASSEARADLLLRQSRLSMVVLLIATLFLGGLGLAMTLWPSGAVSQWMEKGSWTITIVMVIVVALLQRSLKKHGFQPGSAEVRALLQDEWRQASLNRARTVAFVTVLVAQVPLGLLCVQLPARQAVIAMAVSTVTLGMTVLIGLFLYFDRE